MNKLFEIVIMTCHIKNSSLVKIQLFTPMSEIEEELDITAILIAAFIRQCSSPFNSDMHPITDPNGQKNCVFCEDGYVYLSPDPPDQPSQLDFQRIFKLSSPPSENDENENENDHDSDIDDKPDVEHHRGDYSDDEKEAERVKMKKEKQEQEMKKRKFQEFIKEQKETLQKLTDELKSLTESVADITITEFHLEWGINEDSPPFLLNCDGSRFSYSNELIEFSDFFDQIILFIAYESALSVTPGSCINPDRECIGCPLSVIRQKFELYQAKKYFEPISNDDSYNINSIASYIVSRLNVLFPQMMMANVPCCRHCFNIFAKVSQSRTEATNALVRGRAALQMTVPRPAKKSSREKNRLAQSYDKKKNGSLTGKKKNTFEMFNQTPSGLTIVQNVSQKTYRKSCSLYNNGPFPAYFQKH
ncbi:hypothetical protein TRFO_27529 [Tritrichomonas foetus]|uniref:Uncharacterized protein n=1 Tax=Tritrichomonas foetus TaxID=1144522 RepID=A0A1J4K0Z7_9EUKA|nr:hypothetical protein TRFO_27529 [Tritrichomonas foetus]|eukprot:OHT04907.1 hypothetical protein TRFO_27529 [Tritrichomonas foetus]